MSSLLLLSLFIHCFTSTLFSFRTTFCSFWIDGFRVIWTFKLIESSPKLNVAYSYRTLVPQTILLLCHLSCTSVLSQFSIINIIYFILGVRSGSLTFLVLTSINSSANNFLDLVMPYMDLNNLKALPKYSAYSGK